MPSSAKYLLSYSSSATAHHHIRDMVACTRHTCERMRATPIPASRQPHCATRLPCPVASKASSYCAQSSGASSTPCAFGATSQAETQPSPLAYTMQLPGSYACVRPCQHTCSSPTCPAHSTVNHAHVPSSHVPCHVSPCIPAVNPARGDTLPLCTTCQVAAGAAYRVSIRSGPHTRAASTTHRALLLTTTNSASLVCVSVNVSYDISTRTLVSDMGIAAQEQQPAKS